MKYNQKQIATKKQLDKLADYIEPDREIIQLIDVFCLGFITKEDFRDILITVMNRDKK